MSHQIPLTITAHCQEGKWWEKIYIINLFYHKFTINQMMNTYFPLTIPFRRIRDGDENKENGHLGDIALFLLQPTFHNCH